MNDSIKYNTSTVTGECITRLNELKKYTVTELFSDKYVSGGNVNTDGVDYGISTPSNIIYYLGGIRYNDIITGDVIKTTYSFLSLGYSSPDFFYAGTIKIPEKEKIVSNPKIENDVFINRQEISVFNNNYKLEFIKNMAELNSFAAGSFYNIVNNT